jgi:hypothetical protein
MMDAVELARARMVANGSGNRHISPGLVGPGGIERALPMARLGRRNPGQEPRYAVPHMSRIFAREEASPRLGSTGGDSLAPSPVVRGSILVVGPDGTGKSTLVDELATLAVTHRVPFRQDHYRPGLVRPAAPETTPVTEPHQQTPRSTPGALAKLAVVLFDTLLGAATVWRTARERGVVVVERGWFDMAVDPRRYRLPLGLRWVVRWFGRTVPKADIVVILSGEPLAIHERKPEIGVAEVTRQIESWRALGPRVGRRVVELDSVQTPSATHAQHIWDDLRERRLEPSWRRVPFSPRRLDLHVAGRVSGAEWIHRSYRPIPRLLDPVRPALARFGPREALVNAPTRGIVHVCREMGLRPTGLLAMRSSTEGRWVVGIAVEGQPGAVAKIGLRSDDRLRTEAAVLRALASDQSTLGVPELLWSGELEDTFIVASRARARRRRATTSLFEVSAFCTALVRGTPGRPPIAHGDLAPWNVFRGADGLCVFDWEYATWRRRPLQDLAHYTIQSGALLQRYRPAQVAAELTARGSPGWQHLEECDVDPTTAGELLAQYLEQAPDFARESVGFRNEVLRCLP